MAGRVLLPTACVPTHYALVIEPDHSTLEFTVEETIEVDVVEATTSVTLHSKEIHVRSVVFKGKGAAPVEIKATEISYNLTAVTVKFEFESALPVGAGAIEIKYTGILNGDMSGFYKSEYSDADGTKKIVSSTQFEALDARRAFPCWDEPGKY
jgi:aminopeptidase N